MNYEYCTALNHRNKVYRESELDLKPTHEERYISMFGYDNSIHEHLGITGSVRGFKGHFFCKYLYFDIDSEDLQQSHDMAKSFTLLLYNMLGVNPKSLFISFSGNKGFHIGLHQNLFGGFSPFRDLPARIKVLAMLVLMGCFEVRMEQIQEQVKAAGKHEFNHMDLSIYTPNRIFRMLNSYNAKSGLFKIGLTFDQLTTLSLDQIKELAKEAQSYKFEVPPSQIKPLPELEGLWQYALSFDIEGYNAEVAKGTLPAWNGSQSRQAGYFSTPEKGSRNNDLFRQSALLFDKSELSEQQVLELILLVNLTSKEPLPDEEVRILVHSAFRKTLPNRKAKAPAVREVEVLNDWLDAWADYYTAEPTPLTFVFPAINRDQEENLSGKLACLIGQGGTRKSYFALNLVAENILLHDARVIYSSMEMGKVEMVNRILDIVFEPKEGMPASKYYRKSLLINKTEYLKEIKAAAAKLEDKLILSDVTNKTTDDYYRDLQKTTELYGKVNILCVDGLSMMGGSGSENERFEKHTKELKGLANATGLFIPLICHTTKEAKQYTRDCAGYVRGSGKILDNCDFTISFSNIINEHRSTPENIEYERDFAHIKYYNKRGTGMTLNAIYDFNGLSKKISPSDREPNHYPEYDAFVGSYNPKKKKRNEDSF